MDNTFGSGSFLLSALLEGRNFVGIEKNKDVHLFKEQQIDYISAAKDRLRKGWASLEDIKKESIQKSNLILTFDNE